MAYGALAFSGKALAKLNVLVAALRTALREIVSVWIQSHTTAFQVK